MEQLVQLLPWIVALAVGSAAYIWFFGGDQHDKIARLIFLKLDCALQKVVTKAEVILPQ